MPLYSKEEIVDLLRADVCSVLFTKVDGSERNMTCTLVQSYLPPRKEMPKETGSAHPKPEHLVIAFDLEKDAWRSFDYNKVTKISKKLDYVL